MQTLMPNNLLMPSNLENSSWNPVSDPLPETWDELVKDLPPLSLVERLHMISLGQSLPTHPKVTAFLKQGGERLREGLSSVPFWAEGERKAMEQGGQARVDQYWQNLFANERNLHRPPKTKESFTAAA